MNDPTMTGATNACVNDIPTAIDGTHLSHGCFRFGYTGIETSIQSDVAGLPLMDPGDITAGSNKPSSIGEAAVRPDFLVEMTDQESLPWPVAGYQTNGAGAGSSNAMHFYMVTLSGTGAIVPRATIVANSWGALSGATATYLASTETARAHVIVGPIQL